MLSNAEKESSGWRTLTLAAAIVAPVFAVLWLGITLTSEGEALPAAVVKIVFTILAVGTSILGVRWNTASGVALLAEALVVAAWVTIRADAYSPQGLARTLLLLALPLAVSGVTYVLAGGMKAGTWPPSRFRSAVAD